VAAVRVLVAAPPSLRRARLRRSRLRILHCGLITLFLLAVTIIFTNGMCAALGVSAVAAGREHGIVLRIGYDAGVPLRGPGRLAQGDHGGPAGLLRMGQYFVKNPPGQPELRMLGAVTDEVQPREWSSARASPAWACGAVRAGTRRTAPAEVVITDCEMARDSMPRIVEACRQRRIILNWPRRIRRDTGTCASCPVRRTVFVVKRTP